MDALCASQRSGNLSQHQIILLVLRFRCLIRKMVSTAFGRSNSQLLALLVLAGAAAAGPIQAPFSLPTPNKPPTRAQLVPPSPEYVEPFPLHESLRELYAAELEVEQRSPPINTSSPPSDGHRTLDEPSTPERKAEMLALLNKYAPLFKMASTERYYPSSVDFMFEHYGFIEWENGTKYIPPEGTFNVAGMGHLPLKGKHQMLSVNEKCNPQPELEDEDSYFLYGPAGQPGAMEYVDGQGRVHDDVYGFWVDQGRGVVVSD